MKLRQTLVLGIAAASLALALPSQADSWAVEEATLIAQRNIDDGARRSRQDSGRDERKPAWRDAERDDPQGFGYGYERRQREYGSGEQRQQDRDSKRGKQDRRPR